MKQPCDFWFWCCISESNTVLAFSKIVCIPFVCGDLLLHSWMCWMWKAYAIGLLGQWSGGLRNLRIGMHCLCCFLYNNVPWAQMISSCGSEAVIHEQRHRLTDSKSLCFRPGEMHIVLQMVLYHVHRILMRIRLCALVWHALWKQRNVGVWYTSFDGDFHRNRSFVWLAKFYTFGKQLHPVPCYSYFNIPWWVIFSGIQWRTGSGQQTGDVYL